MKCFTPVNLAAFRVGDAPLFPAGQMFKIVRVVPENGQTVNRDDLLFVISPVATGVMHATGTED